MASQRRAATTVAKAGLFGLLGVAISKFFGTRNRPRSTQPAEHVCVSGAACSKLDGHTEVSTAAAEADAYEATAASSSAELPTQTQLTAPLTTDPEFDKTPDGLQKKPKPGPLSKRPGTDGVAEISPPQSTRKPRSSAQASSPINWTFPTGRSQYSRHMGTTGSVGSWRGVPRRRNLRSEKSEPLCPECNIELPKSGQCDNCD